MLLLLNPFTDKFHTGDRTIDLVFGSGLATLDHAARRAVIKGAPDTVSFSAEYSDEELLREAARRALDVLRRHHGYILFQKYV